MPCVVQLTASRFFGGPERQMVELAKSLPAEFQTVFVSFSENGLCGAFLDKARDSSFQGIALTRDTPRLLAAYRELTQLLQAVEADVLCCHGYKANLLGLAAARRYRIPAIAVSRGWTAACARVRLYEAIDRLVLRWVDKVVCVSRAQADKVRKAGVPWRKILVIRNAIRLERFAQPRPEYRERLRSLFHKPPPLIVGAAGRLSPEKGFDVLVDAAAQVTRNRPGVGFVLFGDGALRESLQGQIETKGLNGSFVLAGFRPDFDQFLPHLDLLAVPSFTEGLPNVVLEAFAAGVPVVATAVGGTPEVVQHGQSGYLTPPGDSAVLARRIGDLLFQPGAARDMGLRGRQRVIQDFAFDRQAQQYCRLFAEVTRENGTHTARLPRHRNMVGSVSVPDAGKPAVPSQNEPNRPASPAVK